MPKKKQLKQFRVSVPAVYYQTYVVTAEDADDARNKVLADEGQQEGSPEYSGALDGWEIPVNEA